MGIAGEDFGKGGRGQENCGEVLCGGVESSAYIWVQEVGTEPPVGEIPQGFPPPDGAVDGGYGPQTSTGWDMGVYTHWVGAGNGGAGGYQGVYRLPLEHGLTLYCGSYYHGLVFVHGA